MNENLDLLVVGPASRETGGVARYLHEQTERLGDGVATRVHDVGTPRGDGVRWAVRSLLLSLWAVLRFPFLDRPDVVHVHSSHGFAFYRASVFVLFAGRVWDCPVVLHVHGSSFDDFVEQASGPVAAYQSLVFGTADRVIALSPYWRSVLEARTDPEKIVTLPNAVDASAYDPADARSPLRVIFVSNHVKRKGIAEFVTAMERLRERGLSFSVSIAGSGPLDRYAERLAETDDAVTYHGYVSERRKRDLLSTSAIYVLPTHGEGLPIAMLEGMAGGNAVVSTTVGSIPEVIGPESGRLVEPGDVDALTDAVAELLADSEGVAEMGRHNRDLVERRYDWPVVIEDLHAVYRSLTDTAQTGVGEERAAVA